VAINLLYGCCQVETCTGDLARTRDFLETAFGAGPIEQQLAQEINAIIPGDYGCDHVGLGEAVFQINQPDPGMIYNGHPSIHQKYLEQFGPCVTNLNFFVDDIVHAEELLCAMGAAIHIKGPSDAARALGDYGPANTRAGAAERPFVFLGTRHLIGLDLEIMEPNFLRFTRQTVQHPAFVHPRPAVGDSDLLLERLRIVVEDIDAVLAHIRRIFLPGCTSRPYGFRQDAQSRSFRVTLGGIEIEYCEPVAPTGTAFETLAPFGPGVDAIVFSTARIEAAAERAGRFASIADASGRFGLAEGERGTFVASRPQAGFDVALVPRRGSGLPEVAH
jgi:hypothetical protein